MTGTERMLNAVAGARRVLEAPACRAVAGFVSGCITPDGGFRGRSRESDLYYSLFGSGGLLALECDFDVPRFLAYVQGFGEGDGLDFVHLCCLARCAALVPDPAAGQRDASILAKIDAYRGADGGFNPAGTGRAAGTAYAAFLALLAYEDLDEDLPAAPRLLAGLRRLRAADGGYGNRPGMREGTTTAAAAALFVQHRFGAAIAAEDIAWLQARFHARGGVAASPSTSFPDLLSTATTVFTLTALGVDLSGVAADTLEFVDLSWNEDGGFGPHALHGASDCEYTFYALMTLGLLTGGHA